MLQVVEDLSEHKVGACWGRESLGVGPNDLQKFLSTSVIVKSFF